MRGLNSLGCASFVCAVFNYQFDPRTDLYVRAVVSFSRSVFLFVLWHTFHLRALCLSRLPFSFIGFYLSSLSVC